MMPQNIRVLIVDDLLPARNGLKALLATEMGIEIAGEAIDGREAVRFVEELQPELVLMDARMPVMDGIEAARLIKRRWPQVKILMLSMYSSFQADGLAAGADAFLLKGCTAEELLEEIFNLSEQE